MKKDKKYSFWNWGTGLAIAISIGVFAFLFMVYQTQKIGFDNVVENSYDAEIHHNDNMEARANAAEIEKKMILKQADSSVIVLLPEEMRTSITDGKITFYRPSDKSLDKSFNIETPENGSLIFPISDFKKGKYEVQLLWKKDNKNFETNHELIIK